ncbi:MAG: hypothetical protein K0Q79_2252 [Flavipsychrobacter sp.]|jgi:hypothetical protein|nr:hypothetical protein [Flavipsychrobacter sp.]
MDYNHCKRRQTKFLLLSDQNIYRQLIKGDYQSESPSTTITISPFGGCAS